MISSSATTPNLSRSSSLTEASLASSYSSSLITPASAIGPSFATIQDNPDDPKFRGTEVEFSLDQGCMDVDVGKGTPGIGVSLATAVRRAKTFARRTVNVRRVISRTKRRDSVSEDNTDAVDILAEDGVTRVLHSDIAEEARISSAPSSTSLRSLSSLREITESTLGVVPTSLQNKASISSISLVAVHGSPNPSCYDNGQECTPGSAFATPLHVYAARGVLFVPWCIFVGGLILLSPKHLSRLPSITTGASPPATSPAVLPVLPPPGPLRFAYWAECAYYHAAIFLGCIFSMLWVSFRTTSMTSSISLVGTCVLSGLLARWAFVWKSGLVLGGMSRTKRIQLGQDDAESVWLVLTEMYLANRDDGLEIYVGDARMPVGLSVGDFKANTEDGGEGEASGPDSTELGAPGVIA